MRKEGPFADALRPRRCDRETPRGRCRRFAIRGGTLCSVHGGNQPDVRRAAAARLAAAIDPAIGRLLHLIEHATDEQVVLKAIGLLLKYAQPVPQPEPALPTVDLTTLDLDQLRARHRHLGRILDRIGPRDIDVPRLVERVSDTPNSQHAVPITSVKDQEDDGTK